MGVACHCMPSHAALPYQGVVLPQTICLARKEGPGGWVDVLTMGKHVWRREPWVGEGYGRPLNSAPLYKGIRVLAPRRSSALPPIA